MNELNLVNQLMIILIIIFLLDVAGVMLFIYITGKKKSFDGNVQEIAADTEELLDEDETEIDNTDSEDYEDYENYENSDVVEDIDALLADIEKTLQDEPALPVIRVENVTMEFKVSTVQASGIKEFLILKLKKQNTFRKLKALDQISFTIRKGEVVGIIGTNGSGKSTILKIISGALKPTKGRVKVDTRKVQLLTLGTGFDMELTARENIYLNGAIIGYSREYIDQHFDEIVAFAELEDFVDEKLKNYSSGMVSRLGFAIATSGEAAEILILDEVLAVGDIKFKEKSMKRIQEMIHGGSTVIMVSHSPDTIINQCTRAIWIEKGKLLEDGDSKIVCKKYEAMQKA